MKISNQPPILPNSRVLKQFTKTTPAGPVDKDRLEPITEKTFVDRRKKKDRRSRRDSRGPYDSRAGRDRRKGSQPGGNVEIEV